METIENSPADGHAPETSLERLRRIDASRPGFPGEHLIVFGAGAWLMLAGMRSGPGVKGLALTALGTTLIGRAASGTGGIARLARVVKRLS
ncbi:hypothetical protein ACXIUT_14510 [Achromobacter denitrificans]